MNWWGLLEFILRMFASAALVKLPSSSCSSLCCSLLPWFLFHTHFFLLSFFVWTWGFFVFFFFDGIVLLPGYLDIFVYLGFFVWKAAMAIPVLLVTLKEDLEILEYVCWCNERSCILGGPFSSSRQCSGWFQMRTCWAARHWSFLNLLFSKFIAP